MRIKLSPLDKLFSEYIRKRAIQKVGGCERCGHWKENYKQLQCCHFWGRSKKNTRFDEENAVGLCPACHMYFGAHPAEYRDWFLKRLGQEAYDMLEVRAHKPQKIDKQLIELYLKEKLKEEK